MLRQRTLKVIQGSSTVRQLVSQTRNPPAAHYHLGHSQDCFRNTVDPQPRLRHAQAHRPLRPHLSPSNTISLNLFNLAHHTIHTMSDDASYMSFLNKANADPKSGQGSTMAESESTSQRRSDLDPT